MVKNSISTKIFSSQVAAKYGRLLAVIETRTFIFEIIKEHSK